MGGISDSLSGHFIWKYELTLEFTLASQRSFLQKTNECFNCMKMVCCKLMRIGNNYDRKQVSAISSSSKITTSGKNFTFCWFWRKKNALKLFELHVFRFNGMPNSMALVLSLYTKWFMKNHNFRGRHIVENGVQNHEHGINICSSPPWVPFYPYTMFQNPISWPSHKKCRKTIITQKVLVTQSSNIVHCNWHTQKPICADLQDFANTFSLCKLTFFSVLS